MDYIIEHEGVKYYAGGSKEKYEQRQLKNPGKKAPTWLWSRQKYENGLASDEIVFKNGNIYNKVRYDGFAKKPFINIQKLVSQQTAQKELNDIFGKRVFDHPKPPQFVEWLVNLIQNNKNAIILDFMAGTGTTGHAVLELNKEDDGNRRFILCTNNENNNGNGYKIAEDICYPRIKKVIEGYKNLKGEKVEGLGGNLKYFKTEFVNYDEPTDRNKIKLTEQAIEMLCVKEGTFEEVLGPENVKVFKNSDHYTAIIFDQLAIPKFKEAIKGIKGKFSVYVFSLGDETFDDEFFANGESAPSEKDLKKKIILSSIPEAILRVYRRIFK